MAEGTYYSKLREVAAERYGDGAMDETANSKMQS